MSKLKQFNGRFCEYDFENVFIQYLEDAGWTYQAGDDIARSKLDETLILEDLKLFLKERWVFVQYFPNFSQNKRIFPHPFLHVLPCFREEIAVT